MNRDALLIIKIGEGLEMGSFNSANDAGNNGNEVNGGFASDGGVANGGNGGQQASFIKIRIPLV